MISDLEVDFEKRCVKVTISTNDLRNIILMHEGPLALPREMKFQRC